MFKTIKKFLYKQKQLDALQKKVWKTEIELDGLRNTHKEAMDTLGKIEKRVEMEKKLIEETKTGKDYHTVENRTKVKNAEENIEKLNRKLGYQQRAISYLPKQREENPGITQMIEVKEVMIIETKKVIQQIKDKF